MDDNGLCKLHSGLEARIENCEGVMDKLMEKDEAQDKRINSIFTRLNIILGGVVVSCILFAINLFIK